MVIGENSFDIAMMYLYFHGKGKVKNCFKPGIKYANRIVARLIRWTGQCK
jgi:hypothetical protein